MHGETVKFTSSIVILCMTILWNRCMVTSSYWDNCSKLASIHVLICWLRNWRREVWKRWSGLAEWPSFQNIFLQLYLWRLYSDWKSARNSRCEISSNMLTRYRTKDLGFILHNEVLCKPALSVGSYREIGRIHRL